MLIQNAIGMIERSDGEWLNQRMPAIAISTAAASNPDDKTKNRRASKLRGRADGEIDTNQPRNDEGNSKPARRASEWLWFVTNANHSLARRANGRKQT
ncbi:hypothetical protein LBMAG52_17330 [Planctomycetia bacterium]|nr:hypothetical protein LBMAG52_17330 [Planctomycetia bacterium]